MAFLRLGLRGDPGGLCVRSLLSLHDEIKLLMAFGERLRDLSPKSSSVWFFGAVRIPVSLWRKGYP